MFTYKYKNELGKEVTINISYEIHKIVADEPKFERRIKDEYKNHITDLPDEQYDSMPSPVNLEELFIMKEELQVIFDIVNCCTQKQRRRFILHFAYGLTQEEIARVEGCTRPSVQRSIQQVLRKIMNNL